MLPLTGAHLGSHPQGAHILSQGQSGLARRSQAAQAPERLHAACTDVASTSYASPQARTSFEAAYRPPLGLKLKKSPSALEFFRRALAEQQLGQQQALQTGQGQSATQPPQQQPQQQPKSSSASGQASSLVLPLSMLTLSLERPSEDSDDEQRSITFSQMMAESCDDASGSCSPMHSVMASSPPQDFSARHSAGF